MPASPAGENPAHEIAEAFHRALPHPEERPTVEVWPTAGRALGLSRTSTYKAANDGLIPVLKINGRMVVPTAALRRLLGLDADATPAA